MSQQSKESHEHQRQPSKADSCARLEQMRVTLEAQVRALTADLATLEAAITAMRRRYPEVRVSREDTP